MVRLTYFSSAQPVVGDRTIERYPFRNVRFRPVWGGDMVRRARGYYPRLRCPPMALAQLGEQFVAMALGLLLPG